MLSFGIGLAVLLLIVGISIGIYFITNYDYNLSRGIITIVISVALAAGAVVGGVALTLHTESGQRALKTWNSDWNGGIERTITVYNMYGEPIITYTGKFDIDTSTSGKLLFDDENGDRHIIYNTTGTITIDEN